MRCSELHNVTPAEYLTTSVFLFSERITNNSNVVGYLYATDNPLSKYNVDSYDNRCKLVNPERGT